MPGHAWSTRYTPLHVPDLHHIIYLSRAPQSLSVASLTVLPMQAQALNERRHITGVLVYSDGQFMQVLEGEKKIVRDLYARIAQDKRHQNIFKLADKAIAARTFPDWSMAFHAVSPAEFARVAAVRGYRAPGELRPYLPAEGVDSLLLGSLQELLDATSGT